MSAGLPEPFDTLQVENGPDDAVTDVDVFTRAQVERAVADARAEGYAVGRKARYCGCGWCCATTDPKKRGDMHQRTCQP